jgi:hypothetical protein
LLSALAALAADTTRLVILHLGTMVEQARLGKFLQHPVAVAVDMDRQVDPQSLVFKEVLVEALEALQTLHTLEELVVLDFLDKEIQGAVQVEIAQPLQTLVAAEAQAHQAELGHQIPPALVVLVLPIQSLAHLLLMQEAAVVALQEVEQVEQVEQVAVEPAELQTLTMLLLEQ